MYSKELDKSFANKEELFDGLFKSKKDIISLKKAEVILSKDRAIGVPYIGKSKLDNEVNKATFSDNSYYYVAVNTTNILDSHGDLHVDGIWNKSAKEQSGKNFLVEDHKFEMDKVIVKKQDIEIFVKYIPFSAIGRKYEGDTQALIYKFKKDKVREGVGKEWLESGDDIEASVKMQYVDIRLAMDSNDASHVEEKANYDEYVPRIANKSEFGDLNYFWVVKQAKNIGESSLVLSGSNGATGVVDNKNTKDTDKNIEPSNDTHEENTQNEPLINYKYLTDNYIKNK